ncbi:hypothetical protein DPMN_128088 [Dreissena polymorpha]|uniref:Uncharacterized protein n=1 Tax=Dreissena polymorpha TaxID=45954 RepID=A0A9D4JZD4_DREPO|nr:hypothetical protein DPMN_128088 [Dreissena polymorpha]
MTPRFKQTIHLEKTAPHPESHIFPPILTIFELVHDINKTNILTKFHDRENIGHKSAGRTEGRTDGQRQNNIPPPMVGDNKIKINNRHIMFKLKKVSLNLVYLKELNKSVTIYVKAIQH